MKKMNSKQPATEQDDMLPEYDLAGMKGVRGKYYQAYRQGHTVTIHHEDGTITVQNYEPMDGAVILEPDVRAYFPTAEAVNHALRSLIALFPAKVKAAPRYSKA